MEQQTIFDVAVIGLGAMGSSTFYHLAKQKIRVLGIEQFEPPHPYGSSHGETRVTRTAYFEDPAYVPLAQESQRISKEIEKITGEKLYEDCGIINIGTKDSEVITGVKKSNEQYNLNCKYMTRDEVNKLNPVYNLPQDYEGILEETGGYLFPEKCIDAFIKLAQKFPNAKLYSKTKMLSYSQDQKTRIFNLVTDNGIFQAKKLILSCGIWAQKILAELNINVEIQKNQLVWFDIDNPNLKKDKFKVFLACKDQYDFYGFPDFGTGFKVALHGVGPLMRGPDQLHKQIDQNSIEILKDCITTIFKIHREDLKIKDIQHCYYTNTNDGHFIIDFYPDNKDLLILSPCSGHGFKFAAGIGKLASKMVQTGEVEYGDTFILYCRKIDLSLKILNSDQISCISENELFLTPYYDYAYIDSINSKCEVLSYQTYDSLESVTSNQFFTRAMYDNKKKKLDPPFEKWNKGCICKQPLNPDLQYIQCEMCENWFHLNCVQLDAYQIDIIEKYICTGCKRTNLDIDSIFDC